MHRVVIQVAMALGASVQPLTKITPIVSSTEISSTGLEDIALTKYENDTSINSLPTLHEAGHGISAGPEKMAEGSLDI